MVANRKSMFGVIFVFVLFHVYSYADVLDEQYIGCYQDSVAAPDLEYGMNSTTMTISSCVEHCKGKSKTYAGAQNGGKCFCGDTYGKYGPSDECKINCPGNTSYYCGGNLQNSIYSVCPIGRYGTSCNKECHCSKDAPCNLLNGNCSNACAPGWSGTQCAVTAASTSQLAHFGCFTDARNNGFPPLYNDEVGMTIQLCMDRCRTEKFGLYVGLQYRYFCFCGNSSYSATGASTNCGSDCGAPTCNCAGASADRCGGALANDVYSTCQDGYYGVLCSHQCHCYNGSNCTMEDGRCSNGCSEGWTGTSCNMRNCTEKNGNCTGGNVMCTYENTGEGAERVVPRCRCKEGYNRSMEYQDCQDINECAPTWPNNECNSNFGTCINLPGTYNCTCNAGFENENNGNKSCIDINECATNFPNNECNSNFGTCINLPGTYNCTCKAGFENENNGNKSCKDIDECLLAYPYNECNSTVGNCANTLGDYSCECFKGYSHNGSDSASERYCIAVSPKPGPSNGAVIGAVVGTLCAVLIILAVLAFLYWRNRKQREPSSDGRRNSGFSYIYKEDINGSIEVDQLWKIQTTQMSEEFKSVSMEADHPTDIASSPELKKKNKYRNILPYDHNRVKLNVIDDDPLSDYINASFITTHRRTKIIASHGPQHATVNDFWRMIWEQDVAVVVMITKCIENGRQKCEQYWPEVRETITFGGLEIASVKEESFADYTIRSLRISCSTQSRVVNQFHFMAWPDHDVPTHAFTLLKFRRNVLKYISEDKGVVIHCSAGVGRTGTYIAIDNLLCEAEDSNRVNVLKCLQNLRQQRMHMIQTEGQYSFVYLAIVEACMVGETTSSCSEFIRKFTSKKILKVTLEREYQALEKMKPYLTDDDKQDALLPINLTKNRDLSTVPASRHRVFLHTREKNRNDYINAVFSPSFHSKGAYLQTQLPLPDTSVDFWNMCSDYKCQSVVVLDENNHPDFIPTMKEPLAFQQLIVYYKAERPIPGGIAFDLRMVAKRKSQNSSPEVEETIYANADTGNPITVTIISSLRNGSFDNNDILSLYHMMRAKCSSEQQSKTPVVVMCRNGCTHSSLFICMSNLADMVESQQEVDVFETVHDIRMTRPQAVESLVLYEQLYALALLMLQGSGKEAANNRSDEDGAVYINH